MKYSFNGTSVNRVTVNSQEIVMTPGESFEIDKPDVYISELEEQGLISKVEPTKKPTTPAQNN